MPGLARVDFGLNAGPLEAVERREGGCEPICCGREGKVADEEGGGCGGGVGGGVGGVQVGGGGAGVDSCCDGGGVGARNATGEEAEWCLFEEEDAIFEAAVAEACEGGAGGRGGKELCDCDSAGGGEEELGKVTEFLQELSQLVGLGAVGEVLEEKDFVVSGLVGEGGQVDAVCGQEGFGLVDDVGFGVGLLNGRV